ncbi:MAG: malate synthase G, partial [Pseudomonadota bacterium]
MARETIERHGLTVDATLDALIDARILPGTGVTTDAFWRGFAAIVADFAPRNRALLAHRDGLQRALDDWHRQHPAPYDAVTYRTFLTDIGYLVPEGEDFEIGTANVDPELAAVAGPQLVVPVMNARFALNAANARWGSLYDALYGTDVIADDDGAAAGAAYNPVRGDRVIAWGRRFLDATFPLDGGSHADATAWQVRDGALTVTLGDGTQAALADAGAFAGLRGDAGAPEAVLLRHHGLHVEVQFDADHAVGANDKAHIKDLLLESAVTTIQDFEDSVAAVDAEDKAVVYGHWLGLMQRNLTAEFDKGGRRQTRRMSPDRAYVDANGTAFTLPGCSLLLARNVGLLMTTDAVLDANGEEIPENLLDAAVTALAAMHDLAAGADAPANTRTGSVYIVKPKLHGPDEVTFTCDLFARVEQMLGLAPNTLKVGIMDEERRTTVNLKACIRAARERVIFINTGFLDRTGDELHTSMEAGPMVGKNHMKAQPWIGAYENWNVDIGLACGFRGRAQIGKGMWPKPDELADMVATKSEHPLAGANCAWVPSPTAATLHALHYHQENVFDIQNSLPEPMGLDALLSIPLARTPIGP